MTFPIVLDGLRPKDQWNYEVDLEMLLRACKSQPQLDETHPFL